MRGFHNAQCYYAISLQVASLVALYGPNAATEDLWDETVLLLVSADGIISVVLVFHVLVITDKRDFFLALFTSVTVLLSSIAGYHITRNKDFGVSKPLSFVEYASVGQWPAACGATPPQILCATRWAGFQFHHAKTWFLGLAISLDVITILLFLWHVIFLLPESFRSGMLAMFGCYETTSSSPTTTSPAASAKLHLLCSQRASYTMTILNAGAGILFAVSCAVEFFFFYELIVGDSLASTSSWTFGQIVGILIWFSVLVDLAVAEGSKLMSLWPGPARLFSCSKTPIHLSGERRYSSAMNPKTSATLS